MNQKTVMVSGCFDGLHAGHVSFLQEAAKFGELIVIVGTDENIKLLKGENRPIFPLHERLFMLSALAVVKYATVASGSGVLDFREDLISYRPTTFVVNTDGHTEEKQNLVEGMNIKYVILDKEKYSRYVHRSTTQIYQ